MIGILVGTACLIGLIKVIRGPRWGRGYYGRHGYGRGYGCGYRGGSDCGPGGGDCGPGADDCGGGGGGGGWRGHRHGFGHRHHHGFGGFGPGGGVGGFDRDEGDDVGGGFGGPVLLRGLFSRLQTTPGQEKVIAEALKELRGAFKKSAEEKAKGAKQVAEALRGDDFKVENMGEAFAHLDQSSEAVRDAMFAALAKIHDVLDDRQRKQLAELVGRGGRALENLAEQA